MKCSDIQRQLVFFIEKKIPLELSDQIIFHLESCKKCKHLYINIEATYNSTEDVSRFPVNPFFYTRLIQKIKNEEDRNKSDFFGLLLNKLSIPALFLLVLTAIYIGISLGSRLDNDNRLLVSENTRMLKLQQFADEYYLNELNEENIESILLTDK